MFPVIIKVQDVAETNQANLVFSAYKSIHPIGMMTEVEPKDLPISHVYKRSIVTPDKSIDLRYRWTYGAQIPLKDTLRTNHANANSFHVDGHYFRHWSQFLLVTNIYNDLRSPLFFRHDLGNISNTSLTLYYEDGKIVPSNKYKVLKEVDSESSTHAIKNVVIAHSLEGKKCYFFESTSAGRIRKLLDTKPLFIKDSLYSLGYNQSINSNGELLVYTVNDIGREFEYSLPISTKSSYREGKGDYLHAWVSKHYLSNEPWFACVNEFHIKGSSTDMKLAEMDKISYYPYKPYYNVKNDFSLIKDGYIVLDKYGIVSSYSVQNVEKYIQVLLYKRGSTTFERAITNDASLHGAVVESNSIVQWEYFDLSSSYWDGLIYIPTDIRDYDYAKVSYPCERHFYEFKNINLNPFLNTSLIGKTVIFYARQFDPSSSKSLYYLIHDEDLFITSTDDPNVTVGTLFTRRDGISAPSALIPSPGIPIVIKIGSTFTEDEVDTSEVIILLEVSIPESLDESPYNVITDVRGLRVYDDKELLQHAPNRFVKEFGKKNHNIMPIPQLNNVLVSRLHWTNFSDYIPGKLYSKDEITRRMQTCAPAGVRVYISPEGVPELACDLLDRAAKTVTLSWLPVIGCQYQVYGEIYKGTDLSIVTTLVSAVTDLSKRRSVTVAFGSDSLLYFKIRPYIMISGQKYYGPDSNIIKFSF